jgi:hypothetical protein
LNAFADRILLQKLVKKDAVRAVLKEELPADLFAFLPLAKIKVRLGPALAGGAHPHRI